VAQGVGLEFKPQYHKKKERKKEKRNPYGNFSHIFFMFWILSI
jgi:hypothetical protein